MTCPPLVTVYRDGSMTPDMLAAGVQAFLAVPDPTEFSDRDVDALLLLIVARIYGAMIEAAPDDLVGGSA